MRKNKVIIAFAVVFVLLFAACGVYLGDYYRADTEAIEAFVFGENVNFSTSENGTMSFYVDDSETGFIFYPGGKVEYTAYIPLMKACASRGITCVLLEMPFNLAVLDVNAAKGIAGQYPEIKDWYIGGHSLGGSMAASYAFKNAEDFKGVILLGSYSTADISDSELEVLSVFGSEDRVLNREKYEQYRGNLPQSFSEYVIDGGCHAYFGSYGVQDGDGIPTITNEEQIMLTAKKIAEFID